VLNVLSVQPFVMQC